ncbi:MAG: glycoside hydrolase family 78 protein [Tannerella sp.]|jgi:alpha-L-rhamnosidase|nr:glycoside hydrolase family 78 protein [Tannerella sp.]
MKRYLYIRLLCAVCLSTAGLASCRHETLTVGHLQCEYLSEPVAVESYEPLLSWRLYSAQRGKSQTAYRILAASDPALLSEGKADLWDSDAVASSQSVQVKYGGKAPVARQQVYWKVRVWDENNRPTDWSRTATWSTGLSPSDWKARWIGALTESAPASGVTYPATWFRREFTAARSVRQAKAYVCGLGFYEMYLNGKKVGDQVLAPAVTNYDVRPLSNLIYFYDDQSTRRVLYNTFDVTGLLQEGTNTIGAVLGNGWYNQRDRREEGDMWYDLPKLCIQLEIAYADGSTETVSTDGSWKCTAAGPLLHDGIFTGERYDARLDLGAWNRNGYDDSAWQPALTVRPPAGRMEPQLAPFDRVTRTLTPEFKGRINDSTFLYVLPEMISGWAEISVQGRAGDEIRLHFCGEEEESFGQLDTYILKGGAPERWEPRFTWHAFRTVRAVTREVEMNGESLVVKAVNTDPAQTGHFTCSNELFNRINASYLLTQRGNFHGSISSDCPHRERLAYTGDGQVAVESALWSFDMTRFYRKWFNDMDDARNRKTGYVPHTAPFGGGGGGPAWGSAYLIMPWAYYCFYGDTSLLEQHYAGMKQWVAYLGTRTDERGIVVREEPHGWCLGDWCTPDRLELPEPLVNTAYYFHSATLMAKIAGVVGNGADSRYFTELAGRIGADFHRVFFNPETRQYGEGRQGANVFPLAFGMTPEGVREDVFRALLEQLDSIQYRFDTGILATPLLLQVLTENGRADVAYRLMNRRTEPGFAYLMDDAYTCLWETWDGKASRDHPMFGSVVAWMYRSLAGIRCDGRRPGMKHILIAPQPMDDLTAAAASFESLYGVVRSEWSRSPGHFELTVEIPANTSATVRLPNGDARPVSESGVALAQAEGVRYLGEEAGCTVVEITSGTYRFIISD